MSGSGGVLSLIVAMNPQRVIGRDRGLPWHLPADLGYFKHTTLGKPVLMGRRTYESIGRALPGRRNIVLTGDPHWQAPGCERCDNLAAALELTAADEEVFVIGGAQLYASALPECGRLYITLVEAPVPGDSYFPEFDRDRWRLISSDAHEADEANRYPYRFEVYERVLRSSLR